MPDPHHSDGERVEEQLRDLKFGARTYTPEQAKTIHQAVAERKPLPAPPAGQEEESWPVMMVLKHRVTDNPPGLSYLTYDFIEESEAEQFRNPAEPDFSVETYYPESHPAVLSPEEAAAVHTWASDEVCAERQIHLAEAVFDRLRDYGKEHHAGH